MSTNHFGGGSLLNIMAVWMSTTSAKSDYKGKARLELQIEHLNPRNQNDNLALTVSTSICYVTVAMLSLLAMFGRRTGTLSMRPNCTQRRKAANIDGHVSF